MRFKFLAFIGFVISCIENCHAIEVPENARELYEDFKRQYGKNHANCDDENRFNIFKQNLLRIQLYQKQERGTAEYGVTKFADLTPEEFASVYTNSKLELPTDAERLSSNIDTSDLPKSFDWREHGAVTPVEAQGKCGSCYAFSTVGNIESQWFVKKGELLVLSKQQVVDCDFVDKGCDGGYPPDTFKQIDNFGGLELQSDYPYKAVAEKCHMKHDKFVAYINGSVILSRNEAEHAAYLVENGPLSVGVNADKLQFYRKGISNPWFCYPQGINHGVLTVGYGVERGTPFWIVKNSWGQNWGEDGYFRIYRGKGTCGINRLVSSAIIH